jgi:dolichol-phosphate mannosyltransferase
VAVPRGARLRRLPRACRPPPVGGRLTRALVTGAGGFVGANLVRRLLEEGNEVLALVRPGGDTWRLDGLDTSVVATDLRDAEAVSRVFRSARPSWVFHLAAHGGYSWQADSAAILESTVLGTATVLESAARASVEAVVQAGSSSEYGPKAYPPTEDALLAPDSVYGVAKAAATHLGRHAASAWGLRTVTLRLYSVYGPFEDPRRFVPSLVTHALAGRLPALVAPETARDFVYVDDAVDAFVLAATGSGSSGSVYNVGSGRQTTIREAVETARQVFGVQEAPRWGSLEPRSWDTPVWVADVTRARVELAWRARTDLADGLRRTADWLQGRAPLDARYRLP